MIEQKCVGIIRANVKVFWQFSLQASNKFRRFSWASSRIKYTDQQAGGWKESACLFCLHFKNNSETIVFFSETFKFCFLIDSYTRRTKRRIWLHRRCLQNKHNFPVVNMLWNSVIVGRRMASCSRLGPGAASSDGDMNKPWLPLTDLTTPIYVQELNTSLQIDQKTSAVLQYLTFTVTCHVQWTGIVRMRTCPDTYMLARTIGCACSSCLSIILIYLFSSFRVMCTTFSS
jgi:hypothetical protein